MASELTKVGKFILDILPAQEEEGSSFHADLSGIPEGAAEYGIAFTRDVEFSADYLFVKGRLVINGKLKAVVDSVCDRCLAPVEVPVRLSVSQVLYKEAPEDDDEAYTFTGEKICIDKLLLDEISLNMPTKVLCKEDCKGLCPICGVDLNKTICDCKKESIDESNPFSKLAGLFKDDEEV